MTSGFLNLQNILKRQEYYLHQGPAGYHGLILNCSFGSWRFSLNELIQQVRYQSMKFCWMPTNYWHRQSLRKTYHIWPNELTIMHFYPTHETGDSLARIKIDLWTWHFKSGNYMLAFQVAHVIGMPLPMHNQQIIKAAITDEVSWCKIQFVVWHRPPWIKHVPNQVHQVPEIAPHLTKSCKKMISLRSQNIQGRVLLRVVPLVS